MGAGHQTLHTKIIDNTKKYLTEYKQHSKKKILTDDCKRRIIIIKSGTKHKIKEMKLKIYEIKFKLLNI